MTEDDKMLIFNNADNDMAMLPLSRLKDINSSGGALQLVFDAEGDVDVITLSTVADEFEACKDLVRAFNQGPHSDGAILIADDVSGTYCSPKITGVTIA